MFFSFVGLYLEDAVQPLRNQCMDRSYGSAIIVTAFITSICHKHLSRAFVIMFLKGIGFASLVPWHSQKNTFHLRNNGDLLSTKLTPCKCQLDSVPSRRLFLQRAATIAVFFPHSASFSAQEDVTGPRQVFLDISVSGRPKGRITIELFYDQAPASARTFDKLANGTLRNRSGRTASYRYSQGSRVVPNSRVYLGRLNQIDAVNQSPGTPQRQQPVIEYPYNEDRNSISHDRPGLVTLYKGGSFEFAILAKPEPDLDSTNTVIGCVVGGMDVVDSLVHIPTNRKTIRDGYRNIGKFIGDPRANVQVSWPGTMCLSFSPKRVHEPSDFHPLLLIIHCFYLNNVTFDGLTFEFLCWPCSLRIKYVVPVGILKTIDKSWQYRNTFLTCVLPYFISSKHSHSKKFLLPTAETCNRLTKQKDMRLRCHVLIKFKSVFSERPDIRKLAVTLYRDYKCH